MLIARIVRYGRRTSVFAPLHQRHVYMRDPDLHHVCTESARARRTLLLVGCRSTGPPRNGPLPLLSRAVCSPPACSRSSSSCCCCCFYWQRNCRAANVLMVRVVSSTHPTFIHPSVRQNKDGQIPDLAFCPNQFARRSLLAAAIAAELMAFVGRYRCCGVRCRGIDLCPAVPRRSSVACDE